MTLQEKFKNHRIILASGSPRRQELFGGLDLSYVVMTKDTPEVYPDHLVRDQITTLLARTKAEAFRPELEPQDVLVTADTIVWFQDRALEKPRERAEAIRMLQALSGDIHEVISTVCITTHRDQIMHTEVTEVHFNQLTNEEITHYVDNYQPYDKAGAYGIQEWLGYVGVSKLVGCYYNVMGLPVKNLYEELKKMPL
jgi:septum formation protein